jgi:NAD+ synthetase
MTGGFNLIGDLYKTDVYRVVDFYNEQNPQQRIPSAIIKKAPSAELAPHQKDTDSLPEYDVLDPILKLYIEGDLLPQELLEQYERFEKTLSPGLIQKVHHMVNHAEFKRRQAAPIVRVQRRSFGHGRQFPIAANYPKQTK